MVYTMWENTPLKWHKFLTFFLLPLGAILNVCQAILAISDIQNWTGILIPVNIIDLIRFIVCAILGITAIYGCLPSRRRWYGPKCAIILYAVLSVYSVADGLFCREIDGLFCRSSPDSVVRRRCVLSLPSCFVI